MQKRRYPLSILCLATWLLASCGSPFDQSSPAPTVAPSPAPTVAPTPAPALYAGLRDSNGNPVPTHTPHTTTGIVRNIVDYGAIANDGIDDTQAFEAAYAACNSNTGDEVYFPDGTWDLKSACSTDATTHIKLSKNFVNIRGQSKVGTMVKTWLDQTGSTLYYGIKVMGVHDVMLSNFTLTNAWGRSYSVETETNNPAAGGLTFALSLSKSGTKYAYNITIDQLIVEKFSRVGYRVADGAHDVVIKNSLARNATDTGGSGAGYGFTLQGAGHTAFTTASNPWLDSINDNYHNVLDNVQTEGPYIRHGVIIQYWAHHNLVTNSNFDGCRMDAIDLHGEDEYLNEISNNMIRNGERAGNGIEPDDATGATA